jgi:hypothetical protein
VQEAVDTASLFLNKGLVTYLAGQRFPRQDMEVHPIGPVCALPLAVLINQSTAGPAELVASAMLGNKRGEVVGTQLWRGRLSEAHPGWRWLRPASCRGQVLWVGWQGHQRKWRNPQCGPACQWGG